MILEDLEDTRNCVPNEKLNWQILTYHRINKVRHLWANTLVMMCGHAVCQYDFCLYFWFLYKQGSKGHQGLMGLMVLGAHERRRSERTCSFSKSAANLWVLVRSRGDSLTTAGGGGGGVGGDTKPCCWLWCAGEPSGDDGKPPLRRGLLPSTPPLPPLSLPMVRSGTPDDCLSPPALPPLCRMPRNE